MKIRDIVQKLTEEQLAPTPPPPPSVPVPAELDISEPLVLEVIEKLTKPWQYGTALQRFARQSDTTLEIVKAIQAELQARIKIEALKKQALEDSLPTRESPTIAERVVVENVRRVEE